MTYKMIPILFLWKCLLRWERNYYFAWEHERDNNKIIKNRKFEIKMWL